MGPEQGLKESVCQSQKGGVITSGGGFSMHVPRPWYQDILVSTYLSSPVNKNTRSGYNPYGRGYPDLSFIGVSYPVVMLGQMLLVSGTSASAPVAAALSKYNLLTMNMNMNFLLYFYYILLVYISC